ncbi:MAG: D-alanine--D-alanine ligase A, partial [Lachnospiraceae bacterium]|nr:D-alanine--D-alanine ligase A [Lachnospiraceae bacterium]
METKLTVAVFFGGQSSEHDISCVSAKTVIDAIDKDKYDVVQIGITKDGRWLKAESSESLSDGSWKDSDTTAILSPEAGEKCIIYIKDG